MTPDTESTLAERLGQTVHVSPLRFKLDRLRLAYPLSPCGCIEDWLVAVANARGARVVVLPQGLPESFLPPDTAALSNAELVVGICQGQCRDRPQMLRLAAQLISREVVDLDQLIYIARLERVEPMLAELSRQARRVAPDHEMWREIHARFERQRNLREPLLHWTRLAEPVMRKGRCNAESWRLVA